MTLPGTHGPESRGLSGEHIKLCAEGARQRLSEPSFISQTESLRQTDRDTEAVFPLWSSPQWGLLFLFCILRKEGIYHVRKAD